MPKSLFINPAGELELIDEPRREPGAGEVRLKVAVLGLNQAELLYRRGQYLERLETPSRIGYEVSGTVDAVGPGVSSDWLGAHVGTIPSFSMKQYGAWAEEAIVPATTLARTPRGLSLEGSAAIWMAYVTAFGGLMYSGEMEQGDIALITAASGSVGLAAIEIAKDHGNAVIATTRTADKKQALLEAGADQVIVTGEEDLAERVLDITGGDGVQIIFDAVSGSLVQDLARAASYGARIVEYGSMSMQPLAFPFRTSLNKALTIRGYTLHSVTRDPRRLEYVTTYVTHRLEGHRFHPRIAKVFHGLEEAPNAQDYMETTSHMGKIVVVL